jgi:NADPH:quinone reductase-like Zn-dependent oxidoreductase
MKAVRIHDYGSVEVLKIEDVPEPEIAEDELLIKIFAAAVNPIDWKVREGKLRWRNLHQLPLIPGWDLSGVVERTGKNVANFKPGDEVYSRPDVARNGSYAEFIAVKENIVAFKPKTINFEESASIPLAGLTAWEALITNANIQHGQKVLIHAASGGVGSISVQIAKAFGCYVTGTTSEKNLEFVKHLGADEVIDYKKQDFTKQVKDVDVVLDTVGGQTQLESLKVLKKGGLIVSIINPVSEEEVKKYGVRGAYFFVQSNGKVLAELANLIDSGKIKPVVGKIFSLDEIKKAHELSQSGRAVGKIVIKIR